MAGWEGEHLRGAGAAVSAGAQTPAWDGHLRERIPEERTPAGADTCAGWTPAAVRHLRGRGGAGNAGRWSPAGGWQCRTRRTRAVLGPGAPPALCPASASRWGRGVRTGRGRDTHRHLRPRSSGVCSSSRLQEAELPGPPRRLRPPRPPGSPPALRPVPPHTAPPPGSAVAPLPEPAPPRRSLLPSGTVPSAPRAPPRSPYPALPPQASRRPKR